MILLNHNFIHFIIILLILFWSTAGSSYEVRHTLNSNTSLFSLSLGNVCSTITEDTVGKKCQPALIPLSDGISVSFNGIGKSKGRSIDTGRRLLFDKIDKAFLAELFSNTNFNSFTFNSDLEFYSPYFLFSYSPYYLLADVFLTNPAFPELALLLMKRSTIKLATGLEVSKFWNASDDDLSVATGLTLYHYTDKFFKGSITLLDLTTDRFTNLVRMQERKYLDADLGLFMHYKKRPYLPAISLLLKNIHSPYHFHQAEKYQTNVLMPKNLFEQRSEINLGYNYKTLLGMFYAGIIFPFRGLFRDPYLDYAALAARYNLGLFSMSTSYSQYANTFGMAAKGKEFSISINFAREKEINNHYIKREDSVYVGLEILYK